MQENISLQSLNTFGIHATAKYFATFSSVAELRNILQHDLCKNNEVVILGGGSNVLLTANKNCVILKNEIKDICISSEDDEHIFVVCGAGDSWHEFVLWTIEHNIQGAENLSLIPGTVGAAPMQNIGAYGTEIKDLIVGLQALHIASNEVHTFTNEDCEFGYRESIFKHKYKNQYVILNVEFQLNKIPKLNTSYGAIKDELQKNKIVEPTIKDVSNAVIAIRNSKLPNPAAIGNAGSFFKNPEIDIELFKKLKKKYADMPGYILQENRMKVPAGWLIEQAGWKGYRSGDAGVHALQALVLVNYGNATGNDIIALSNQIVESVKNKFEIELEKEVNIW